MLPILDKFMSHVTVTVHVSHVCSYDTETTQVLKFWDVKNNSTLNMFLTGIDPESFLLR